MLCHWTQEACKKQQTPLAGCTCGLQHSADWRGHTKSSSAASLVRAHGFFVVGKLRKAIRNSGAMRLVYFSNLGVPAKWRPPILSTVWFPCWARSHRSRLDLRRFVDQNHWMGKTHGPFPNLQKRPTLKKGTSLKLLGILVSEQIEPKSVGNPLRTCLTSPQKEAKAPL